MTTPNDFGVALRGGTTTSDVRFDRIDEKDQRSRDFPVAAVLPADVRLRSYTWRSPVQLDQGRFGACVGFAWAHELAARPAMVAEVDATFARERIYFPAQRRDRFPGGAYPGAMPFAEGTSVLAGAKVVQALGYVEEYRWAFDLWDLVAAVGHRGPAVFGCRWYAGMQEPSADGFAHPEGPYLGKHCVMLNGVRVARSEDGTVDLDASWLLFQNSFGSGWGQHGFARLRFGDVQALWDGAETCIPVVRRAGARASNRVSVGADR